MANLLSKLFMGALPFRRAFSLLELLLAMSLGACVLGGLGYWMIHGGQLAQTAHHVLADKEDSWRLEQSLRRDFAHACVGAREPWFLYKAYDEKASFELLTARGKIRYERGSGGWQRVAAQEAVCVFPSSAESLDFSVWGRLLGSDKWASLDAVHMDIQGDTVTCFGDEQTYIFGWIELVSTSGPQRVMHRFRSLY